MPVIPAFTRQKQKQKDGEFKAGLDYRAKSALQRSSRSVCFPVISGWHILQPFSKIEERRQERGGQERGREKDCEQMWSSNHYVRDHLHMSKILRKYLI